MTLKDFLEKGDIFAANAGAKIKEITQHQAVVEMQVTQKHLNAGGVCQGGAIFTLADLALAAMMNYCKQLTLSVQTSIHFTKSAIVGDTLTAIAKPVNTSKKISTYQITVYNQSQEIISILTATAYSKNIKLSEFGVD